LAADPQQVTSIPLVRRIPASEAAAAGVTIAAVLVWSLAVYVLAW